MAKAKPSNSNFLDKVLGRIGRLDAMGLQTVVQRLARERDFLETLFNTIEDGVLVVDETGRILYYNQAAALLIGLQDQSVEGQPVTRYLRELDWEQLNAMDQSGEDRVIRQEFEIQYPQPRFLRLFAAPLETGTGGGSGMALILHDATEARQKTWEAIESERIQALTLLAASVAHEIGNPLNALHIHIQLIERELKKLNQLAAKPASRSKKESRAADTGRDAELWSEARTISDRLEKFLGVAKGEINRLDYIVTQFLQAIRPSSPRIESASINDVVEETLELLTPELKNRDLKVVIELTRGIPRASFDAEQIKQVLVNLIKNAMQAMSGEGRLTVRTGKAREGVWASVEDTGGGIAREKIKQIFQPYYTTKAKGTGLGLMIVQRIIREHGGRIDLDTKVGEGTRFRILLPFHERHPHLLEEKSS